MASSTSNRPVDLVAAGELLVDLISTRRTDDLGAADKFARYQGGSAANLCSGLARLQRRAVLVACVGRDGFGAFLKRSVGEAGVPTDFIAEDAGEPTSLVVVTRSKGTPDARAWRGADCRLQPAHVPEGLLARTRLFHTTCFALSREPARGTILQAAERAVATGAQLSIDINYVSWLWPDRDEAQQIVFAYCRHGAFVKASLDDVVRLFGGSARAEAAAHRFHVRGAALVCLTLGKDGSLVSWDGGRQQVRVPARPVQIADATGAGDAYWAGFLAAWLEDSDPPTCARAGANVAAYKLTRTGPLREPVPDGVLYAPLE